MPHDESQPAQPSPQDAAPGEPGRDSFPFPQPSDVTDPDAAGLPPHIKLPDPLRYRVDQLRAMMVTNAVALAFVTLLFKFNPKYPQAVGACWGAIFIYFCINTIRFLRAQAKLKAREHDSLP